MGRDGTFEVHDAYRDSTKGGYNALCTLVGKWVGMRLISPVEAPGRYPGCIAMHALAKISRKADRICAVEGRHAG